MYVSFLRKYFIGMVSPSFVQFVLKPKVSDKSLHTEDRKERMRDIKKSRREKRM
jgi:hypothetical protein